MRKDQCKFCTSRKCHHRIVTADMGYDEIACIRHSRELDTHADATIPGVLRCMMESTGQVKRGEPYSCKGMVGKESEMLVQLGLEIDPFGADDALRMRKALNAAGYDADPIVIMLAYQMYSEDCYSAGWLSTKGVSDDRLVSSLLMYLKPVGELGHAAAKEGKA